MGIPTLSGIVSSDGSILVTGGGTTVDLQVVGGGGGIILAQDLGGTNPLPLVVGIHGTPVSASAPSAGQALIVTGGVWTPTSIPLGISPGTGIGVAAVAGIYTISNTGVVTFNTRAGAVTLTAADIEALFTAQGDLFVGTGVGTGTILPEGTTGQVLTVKSDGSLYWTTPSGAVSSVFTRTGAVVAVSGDYAVGQVTGAAPLASPTFTGTPVAPTPAALDNSTKLATTAYDDAAVGVEKTRALAAEALLAPLASPALTGTPTAPTKTPLTNNTDIASTAYADAAVAVEVARAEAAEVLLTPLSGWIPDVHTWTYSSVDGHTSVLTVNADVTGTIQLGDRIELTQSGAILYFVVTAITFGAGATTMTLYGGAKQAVLNATYTNGGGALTAITVLPLALPIPSGSTLQFINGDTAVTSSLSAQGATSIAITSTTPAATDGGWQQYQGVNASSFILANSAITLPAYSHHKSPYGFPANPAAWTETFLDSVQRSQASPTTGTLYNLFPTGLRVPIGAWDLRFSVSVGPQAASTGSPSFVWGEGVLSTNTSTVTDQDLQGYGYWSAPPSTAFQQVRFDAAVLKHVARTLTTKATYTLLVADNSAGSPAAIYILGQYNNSFITARCAYI